MDANLEREIARHLLRNYKLRMTNASEIAHRSDSSTAWIVETDVGNFLLKSSNWYTGFARRPKEALEAVYEVVSEMEKRGVPLQGAQRGTSGSFVFAFGGMPTVLLKYILGNEFDMSEAHFASAGEALARFHKSGLSLIESDSKFEEYIEQNIPVEKPYEESRALYERTLRPALLAAHSCRSMNVCHELASHIAALDSAIAFVDREFARAGRLSRGILHNDFNFANGLYDSSGALKAFLDLDQLGVGPLVWDIGNTLASFATRQFKNGKSQVIFEKCAWKFLTNYHNVNPLPDSEYMLILASSQRWDAMRIMRTMRRHHFEGDRLPSLVSKISERLLPRLVTAPKWFEFLTPDWIRTRIGAH